MTTTRPARNLGIDLLRVFSIFMVVVGHAGYFPNSELLTIWRMPLFFMLSGFFFTPGRTLFSEFSRRWDTLLIPYLAWSVIISVWLIAVEWGQRDIILDHLHSGWSGGAGQSIFGWPPGSSQPWPVRRCYADFRATGLSCGLDRRSARVLTSYACYQLVTNGVFETHPLVETPLRLGLAWPVMFYLLVGEQLRKLLMPLVRRYSSRLGRPRPGVSRNHWGSRTARYVPTIFRSETLARSCLHPDCHHGNRWLHLILPPGSTMGYKFPAVKQASHVWYAPARLWYFSTDWCWYGCTKTASTMIRWRTGYCA